MPNTRCYDEEGARTRGLVWSSQASSKAIRGWWWKHQHHLSKKWPLFWEVAPSRINTPPCLWGQTQVGSARKGRAGPCPGAWKDTSCCSGHLSWLGGGHQHNTKRETDQFHYMLSFSPSTCHLWSHFRTGTELLKQVLLRAGSFHSSTLGDSISHAVKDITFLLNFAFEAHIPAPLTLIINSIYGNFSLNHIHNGTGYVEKKKSEMPSPKWAARLLPIRIV